MIPPEDDAEFVHHMEDVQALYHEPYDPKQPFVCFGEHPIPKRADGSGELTSPTTHRSAISTTTSPRRNVIRFVAKEEERATSPVAEAADMAERAKESGATEHRKEFILEIYKSGWTQKEIAELDSMPSRSRISQIINERRDDN